MVNLFRNNREGRLRAFWRLLFQFVLYTFGLVLLGNLILVVFALFSGALLADEVLTEVATSPAFLVLNGVASLIVTLLSVWLAGRFLDRRPFSGFGLRIDRGWWLDFGFGLVLGALLMAGIFFVQLVTGWVSVTGAFQVTSGGAPFFPTILAPMAIFICVGIYEELISRGYQLKNMAEGLNFPDVSPRSAVVLAWVLSSSLFGLLHLFNPNATAISTVNIAFAGLLLGVGYVLTGSLAIPIGLHMTWNFFQGNVFGFPVSGLEPIGATFLSVKQGGPSLLTGGVFGPEAGLLGLCAMVVGGLLIWLWVRVRYGEATLQTSLAESPTVTPDRRQPPEAEG